MWRLTFAALAMVLMGQRADAHMPAEGAQHTVLHPPQDGANAASWCAAHAARGEIVQAYFDCEKAVSDDPSNPRAFANRGAVFLLTNDPDKALADFTRAMALDPHDAVHAFNRGLALSRLGRSNEAIDDYTRATRLDPKLAIALHNRGREHELLLQRDEAVRDYRAALEISPDLEPSRQGLERLGLKK